MKIKCSAVRALWTAGSLLAVGIGYLLCRYTFFELHGMKQWPTILFGFCLFAVLVAAFFDARRVMLGTVAGYPVGLVLGLIFQTDGADPGGGRTNNLWLIWTAVILAAILAGIVWELASRYGKRKKV